MQPSSVICSSQDERTDGIRTDEPPIHGIISALICKHGRSLIQLIT